MDSLYCLPGDIFFTHSNSLLGRLIRWAEHDPNEPNGVWANHVGVVTSVGWLVPPSDEPTWSRAQVIESLWKTEKWDWWDAHKGDKDNEVRVYRRPTLSLQQCRAMGAKANEFVGRTYGWWKLFTHLADRGIFGGNKTISNFFGYEKRPICSFTAAHAYAAAGISFGLDPNAADPDEMMDYCERSGEWVLVGGSVIGGAK